MPTAPRHPTATGPAERAPLAEVVDLPAAAERRRRLLALLRPGGRRTA